MAPAVPPATPPSKLATCIGWDQVVVQEDDKRKGKGGLTDQGEFKAMDPRRLGFAEAKTYDDVGTVEPYPQMS